MKMRKNLQSERIPSDKIRQEIGDLICITPTDKAKDWEGKWAIVGFLSPSKSQIKGVLYLGDVKLVEQLGATFEDKMLKKYGVVMDIILEKQDPLFKWSVRDPS